MTIDKTLRNESRFQWYAAEILKIAEIIAENSGGRIRLVHNEESDSDKFYAEAAIFLKLDRKRLGRDIEQYGFLCKVLGIVEGSFYFFDEVIYPLKEELPESYRMASEQLFKNRFLKRLRASFCNS